MAISKHIFTDGGASFGHNPFDVLSSEGLPPAPENSPPANPGGASVPASRPRRGEAERSRLVSSLAPPNATKPAKKNRGRVDILRQKAGRGGKTVTVVKNFVGIGLPEKEQLARAMQRAGGTGGTVKDGQIEIQGDQRAEVARILTEANFHPVFAGG
jgi:translation initiation factor 1